MYDIKQLSLIENEVLAIYTTYKDNGPYILDVDYMHIMNTLSAYDKRFPAVGLQEIMNAMELLIRVKLIEQKTGTILPLFNIIASRMMT